MTRRKRQMNVKTVKPDKFDRGGYLMPVVNVGDQARKLEQIQRVITESGCRVLPPNWLLEALPPQELAKLRSEPRRERARITGVSLSAAVLEARGRSSEQD